jgi:hypothetical protein
MGVSFMIILYIMSSIIYIFFSANLSQLDLKEVLRREIQGLKVYPVDRS